MVPVRRVWSCSLQTYLDPCAHPFLWSSSAVSCIVWEHSTNTERLLLDVMLALDESSLLLRATWWHAASPAQKPPPGTQDATLSDGWDKVVRENLQVEGDSATQREAQARPYKTTASASLVSPPYSWTLPSSKA